MNPRVFKVKQFIFITLVCSIWIHISEVFRYFVLIMPRTKEFFNHREGIAEMNGTIFTIWGLWDTLLTAILVFIFWLYAKSFEFNLKSVLISGTLVWFAVFVIFWVATVNMGLSSWSTLLIALLLSWIEMIVGTFITYKLYKKNENKSK